MSKRKLNTLRFYGSKRPQHRWNFEPDSDRDDVEQFAQTSVKVKSGASAPRRLHPPMAWVSDADSSKPAVPPRPTSQKMATTAREPAEDDVQQMEHICGILRDVAIRYLKVRGGFQSFGAVEAYLRRHQRSRRTWTKPSMLSMRARTSHNWKKPLSGTRPCTAPTAMEMGTTACDRWAAPRHRIHASHRQRGLVCTRRAKNKRTRTCCAPCKPRKRNSTSHIGRKAASSAVMGQRRNSDRRIGRSMIAMSGPWSSHNKR